MIPKAAEILDVKEDVLSEFEVEDAYNSPNILTGVICRQSDHRYGALVIFKVNHEEMEPQVVFATPKINYPFSYNKVTGDRIYRWPTFIRAVAYEKLDGTNIFAYSYANSEGTRFVTFKTRLTPVIISGTYGDFKAMWDKILEKYQRIRRPNVVLKGDVGLSFELYGYQNPHLIVYDVPLDAALLFAVRQTDAGIMTPNRFESIAPTSKKLGEAQKSDDLEELYTQLEATATNKIKVREDDGMMEGDEGHVLYVITDDKEWIQYKIKADQVKDIHWATGGISVASILATSLNALEVCSLDEFNTAYVVELLKEEFNDQQIGRSMVRVEKTVSDVRARGLFRLEVEKVYDARPKFADSGDDPAFAGKAPLMRYMSGFFDKPKMRYVYNALRELGIVE
jgi:hypothetical protein